MKILFLGTGAADYPASLLNEEKDNFTNKDLRRSSSVLIDEKILIDCGPHVFNALKSVRADFSKITNVFVTHFHADHLNENVLRQIAEEVGHKINVWYSDKKKVPVNIDGVIACPVECYRDYTADGYTVNAYEANHEAFCVHYSFERDGKKLFYGPDGAWLLMKTYYELRDKCFDMMILDCTVGDYNGDYRICEHNSLPMIRLMRESFKTWNIIDENTKIYLSHLAVTLHKPHEVLQNSLKNENLIVAYDGMEVKEI